MIGAGESTLASDSPSAGGRWLMKGGLDSPSGGVRAEAPAAHKAFSWLSSGFAKGIES